MECGCAATQRELQNFEREAVWLLPHQRAVIAGGRRAQLADALRGECTEELRQARKV